VFDEAFTDLNSIHSIENNVVNCDESDLLPAVGEYHVLSLGYDNPVAVSTLGNPELAEKISELKPKGISIVGKTETENIGIEKIIQNTLAVPSIKYLLICGKDTEGHYSGNTLISLVNNGVDTNRRVIGSKGKKAVLSNITKEEINAFIEQIEIIDMIECEDLEKILEKVQGLNEKEERYNSNKKPEEGIKVPSPPRVETVRAEEKDPKRVRLDRSGYFVIVPKADKKTILVEHYDNSNNLLRIIKGEDARNIYWTIIDNGWVTEMSHAAYLGKELTKAEMSMSMGFKYIQDKA